MPTSAQAPLALVGRVLLALMFVLAGFSKLTGFTGTVGYIASQGLRCRRCSRRCRSCWNSAAASR